MKKTIVILFWLLVSVTRGQIGYTLNTSIPVDQNGQLSLPWAGGINFPLFSQIDLNNDNVPDLFVFDRSNNRVLTFINAGGSGVNCWQYAPQYEESFPSMRAWAFLYDYDCDNKPDLFCDSYSNNGIAHYRNISSGGNLIFTLVDSVMQYNYSGTNHTNIGASAYLVPHFNDVDGDGDMDIIGEQFLCLGGYAYYKNLSIEHTGTCNAIGDYEVDHNVWGDFALRSGAYQYVAVGPNDSGIYNWNINCYILHPSEPANPGNPYNIARRDDTYANIFTIDIDNDGDKDALIGDSQTKNSLLLINGGDTAHAHMVSQDTLFPSYDIPVHLHSFAAHAFVDADNDGVKDLLVSQSEFKNVNGVYFYKNTGTNNLPHFNYVLDDFLQGKMIDVGESATPVLFDYDGDGLKDLVIGNRLKTVTDSTTTTGLTLYRNTGTATSPSFEFITDDFAGLISYNLAGQIYPAFGDLDGDNDEEMLLGLDDGTILYFENTAGPGNPPVFAAPVANYQRIEVGHSCTPQLIDLNRDGYLDIVAGQNNGLVKYYQNTTSLPDPFDSIPTNDTLGGIVVRTPQFTDGFAVPFVFEQNNDYRILVSSMQGDILLYGNIDGNLSGTFTLLDTVYSKKGGNRYGNNLSVSGGDLNGDTLTDMIIGFYGGGLQIFYQDNLNTVISAPVKDDLIRIISNPVTDRLIIKSKVQSGKCVLSDASGRALKTQTLNGGYCIIDVTAFSAGVYTLQFSSGKSSVSKKVIISR